MTSSNRSMLSSIEQFMFLLLKVSDADPNTATSVAPAATLKRDFKKTPCRISLAHTYLSPGFIQHKNKHVTSAGGCLWITAERLNWKLHLTASWKPWMFGVRTGYCTWGTLWIPRSTSVWSAIYMKWWYMMFKKRLLSSRCTEGQQRHTLHFLVRGLGHVQTL